MNEHPYENTHLMSDVYVWKHPDRSYTIFIILSILFGFFGLDHIYLRSYPTAIAKLVMNFFTFGLWYVWDILQIAVDGTRIRTEGLNSPFDWLKGIGRGVFSTGNESYAAPKDYIIYTILTFFGCLGADKFYIGEYGQGLVKLISCFNIFLFLFGWFWVLWDWYHAVFSIKSVMKDGISPPLPYSFLFDPIQARRLFEVQDPMNPPSAPPSSSFFSFLPGQSIFDEIVTTFGLWKYEKNDSF
jgi:TM2 domain-containing membrane protein YozV